MVLKHMFLFLSVVAVSAALATAQSNVTMPVQPTPADNGKQMFVSYCAPCHGPQGRGNGPTAAALKIAPADLTQLAKKNGGAYPATHVMAVLKFGVQNPAHGSKEMPTWGPALGNENTEALRINNLVKYVESLQEK
jgi:mono/diheme cytochrome c family protein